MKKITRDVSVGIYENCTDVARIYPDRTVATLAVVRWGGNTGGYYECRSRITGKAHQRILAAVARDSKLAWEIIYEAVGQNW